MENIFSLVKAQKIRFLIASAILVLFSFILVGHTAATSKDPARNGRLITFYDSGKKRVILTHAQTVKDALQAADISVDKGDNVEPAPNTELVSTDYAVNIYRAKPVIIVDGAVRQKIITAAQTPDSIVKDSSVSPLNDEDIATVSPSDDIINDGASTILNISRAIPLSLKLYGKDIQTSTHDETVGEMLKTKGVKLSTADTVTPGVDTPITAGMSVTVWRDGVQTTTIEETINFPTRLVLDFDHPVGYKQVQKVGSNGTRDVTYEFTALKGKELSRKEIQNIITKQPVEQVELVGAGPSPQALSQSRGAQYWTDSRGISHRETYYDLPMNVVMSACGGGNYSIRADGAKVDKDGYILVAAHLGNYPKCTVVETSMGLGKVYDTGGFAKNHPQGFDLATDWSNHNGR